MRRYVCGGSAYALMTRDRLSPITSELTTKRWSGIARTERHGYNAYEHDSLRLAMLGYVVVSVVEEPTPALWIGLIQRLFGAISWRLTVLYSDVGVAPR